MMGVFQQPSTDSSDLGDLGDLGCQKRCPERRRALQANAFRWVIWVIWVQWPESLYMNSKSHVYGR